MKKYGTNKILVAGGYGYGNVGDEAQCEETLKILSERYPNYQIVNLTPNIDYSMKNHPKFFHEFASRVLFFNQNRKGDCFNFTKNSRKLNFIFKSLLILFNSILVKYDLPTILINANISKFLYELKNAKLFYFCGGGYLTGVTLSRFWDGMLICKLCDIFNTPVVMSGQTIGVWKNNYNKFIAKLSLKNVKIITVRDEKHSLNDLLEIGVIGDNYFATHDDALFCDKSKEKQIDLENYITLNVHYWGMSDKEKNIYLKKIGKIITYILEKTTCNLLFIPMHKTDENFYYDYIKNYPNDRFILFNYDCDFRKVRRVISDSKLCITMKHHPIIFAMGEDVPVISLELLEYYIHKNLGALEQYGQENCSLNLEDKYYYQSFQKIFNYIQNNREIIINNIKNKKEILKKRKEKFLKMVDKILF